MTKAEHHSIYLGYQALEDAALRTSYQSSNNSASRSSAITISHWKLLISFDKMEYSVYELLNVKGKTATHFTYIDEQKRKDLDITLSPVVGSTYMSDRDVRALANNMIHHDGKHYALLTNNCQHFVSRLLQRITGEDPIAKELGLLQDKWSEDLKEVSNISGSSLHPAGTGHLSLKQYLQSKNHSEASQIDSYIFLDVLYYWVRSPGQSPEI